MMHYYAGTLDLTYTFFLFSYFIFRSLPDDDDVRPAMMMTGASFIERSPPSQPGVMDVFPDRSAYNVDYEWHAIATESK